MNQQPPVGQFARWDGTQWVPVSPPPVSQPSVSQSPVGPPPAGAPPRKPKPFFTRWWVWALAAVVLLMAVGQARTSPSVAPVPVTSIGTVEPSDPPTDEPAAEPSEESAPAASSTASSTETKPTPTPTPKATPKPTYKALSSRQFKLLAKDPDAYIGRTYVIYGEITQFDAATGNDAFRANTGPKKLRISYGYVSYDQNTVLTGSTSKLKKLVEGDCFTAKVTVLGSYSYDTQVGGNTTVPSLYVDSISVYGSTD